MIALFALQLRPALEHLLSDNVRWQKTRTHRRRTRVASSQPRRYTRTDNASRLDWLQRSRSFMGR
jgi:hypothetical protein